MSLGLSVVNLKQNHKKKETFSKKKGKNFSLFAIFLFLLLSPPHSSVVLIPFNSHPFIHKKEYNERTTWTFSFDTINSNGMGLAWEMTKLL